MIVWQSKTDRKCFVDRFHCAVVQPPHFLLEPSFVNGPDLFQQHYGISGKPALGTADVNMGWKLCFFLLAGDGGCYDRRAVTVPHVILYYEYRPQSSLFGTDYRAEIRIVNIASFDSHADSRSAFDLLGCILSLLFPQKTKLNHGDDKKLLFIIGLPLCFTKASHSFRHNSLGDSTAYAARPFRPGFGGPFSLYCAPSVFDRHTASFSTNRR